MKPTGLTAQRSIRSRALLIVSEAWLEVGKEILVTRSRRARTPVLVKTILTCDYTVCTEITRRSAMSMVEESCNIESGQLLLPLSQAIGRHQ